MTYKVVQMFKLPEAGSLKAFCDMSVDDVLVIKGIRIVEGKNGLFVTMPRERGADSRWYDQVVIKSADEFDKIAKVVLDAYNEKEESAWSNLV